MKKTLKIIRNVLFKLKKNILKYNNIIIFFSLISKFKYFFKIYNVDYITIVITSSGRKEYLEKTISSLKFNLPKEINVVWKIIDDCPKAKETHNFILKNNFEAVIINKKNYGLGYSLNKLYSNIKTKYIFHCEDDWEFLCLIPIYEMISILENDITIGQVILNRKQPYKEKAIIINKKYSIYEKTFSFNPHLTKRTTITKCLPYPLYDTERKITDRLRKKGVKSAIIGYDKTLFVDHLGEEKYVCKY